MNIEELKEVLGDKYDALKGYVDELNSKLEAARSESINGRKSLKTRVAELEALQTTLFDKLGIESAEEIDSLPEAKGQAEALKQFESKIKRLERELTEANQGKTDLVGKVKELSLSATLEKVLGSHEWLDRDVASTIIRNGIVYQDDSPYFKVAEDKFVSLEDGAKLIAQTKPFLLKSTGAGGSGYTGAGGNGGATKQPKREDFGSEFEFQKAAAKYTATANQ